MNQSIRITKENQRGVKDVIENSNTPYTNISSLVNTALAILIRLERKIMDNPSKDRYEEKRRLIIKGNSNYEPFICKNCGRDKEWWEAPVCDGCGHDEMRP